MIMSSLYLRRAPTYSPGYKDGAYTGEVSFTDPTGEIKLNLTPELSAQILAVVAHELVIASREIATNLTAAVITQPQVEHHPV